MTAALKFISRFAIKKPPSLDTQNNQANEKAQIILATVQQIPFGQVSTYGQIARAAGLPGYARYVGSCLKNSPANTPWHRVINQQGKISFAAASEQYQQQKQRLESEGVAFHNDRINLKRYLWCP
ncbi:MAG: cysteine methyltransferase [Gammaproteobacteria bacterium]|nr:MAG: cysteine methyltransferase [Gammaproteobacteria bacterium]